MLFCFSCVFVPLVLFSQMLHAEKKPRTPDPPDPPDPKGNKTCFASAPDAILTRGNAELPTATQWAEFGAGLVVPVPSNLLSKPSGRLKRI